MTRKKNRNNNEIIPYFIDECLYQSTKTWSINEKVETATSLNLKSTKDEIISETLNTKYPDGIFILTKNKRKDKKGDYFKKLKNQCLVIFSIEDKNEQEIYFDKFQRMVKNKSKLLGTKVTLAKEFVYLKKRNKKTIKYKYNQYI